MYVLEALRAIDEQVHRERNPQQGLNTALAKFRSYDAMLVNVARSLRGIPTLSERAYREQLLSRLQKCKSVIGIAWANAAENAAAKLPKNASIGTMGGDLVSLAVSKAKKSTIHLLDNATLAKELGRQHVSVVRYPGYAAAQLVDSSDAIFLPVLAIDDVHIISLPGAATLAQLANGRIPVYAVAVGLQYDANAHKSFLPVAFARRAPHVQDFVQLFDSVPASKVDGIISELGVFSHKRFVEETKAHYAWLF